MPDTPDPRALGALYSGWLTRARRAHTLIADLVQTAATPGDDGDHPITIVVARPLWRSLCEEAARPIPTVPDAPAPVPDRLELATALVHAITTWYLDRDEQVPEPIRELFAHALRDRP